MIKSIQYWPRIAAEIYRFSSDDIVISITDPKQKLPSINHPGDILRLAFYDLPEAIGDSRYDSGLFTENHAKDIISFLDKHQQSNEEKHLIVHCEAGVCRSASVALFAHYYTKAQFDNIATTYAGNILVANILSNVSGIDVVIPEPIISKGGILLL